MDEYSGLPVVTLLSMIAAMAVVFVVGVLALGLPWYAAGIAGGVVGLTSYARPTRPLRWTGRSSVAVAATSRLTTATTHP
jgi:hypothetical protein